MGCCPSKEEEEQEQFEGDVKVITVRQTKVPSGENASVEPLATDSQSPSASQDRLADVGLVPRPPSGQKPSSGSFRRRSGVRLPAALSSHSLPVSLLQEQHIPRPPSVQRTLSLPIKRRSGVRLSRPSSSSSDIADNIRHPTTPEIATDEPSTSRVVVLSQPTVVLKDAPESASDRAEPSSLKDDLRSDVARRPQVTDLESQNIIDADGAALGKGTKDFLIQNSCEPTDAPRSSLTRPDTDASENGGDKAESKTDLDIQKTASILVSEEVEDKDTSNPSLTSVVAEDVLASEEDKGVSMAELEIQKAASFLAEQGIETSLSVEAASSVLVEESHVQVSEAADNTNVSCLPAIASSVIDAKQLLKGDKVSDISINQLEIRVVASVLAAQAIRESLSEETAGTHGLENYIQVSEASHNTDTESDIPSAAKPVQASEQDADGSGVEISVKIPAENVEPRVKVDLDSKDAEMQGPQEELVVKGTAILIPKVNKPSTTRSLNEIKSTASIGKRSSRRQSAGSLTAPKPGAKKGIVGKSQSLGIMSDRNKEKPNGKGYRSASFNATKSVASTNGTPVGKKSSQRRTDFASKKLKPLKSDFNQKRTEPKALLVARVEKSKKSLQTGVGKKEPSKSYGNIAQRTKEKRLDNRKTASSQSIVGSRKGPSGKNSMIKQEKTSQDQSKQSKKNEVTEAVSAKSSVSMDSDIGLTKAIFEVFNSDKKETTVEGFTVFTDGIFKNNSKENDSGKPAPQSRTPSALERISVDRVPTSSPIQIRSGSSRKVSFHSSVGVSSDCASGRASKSALVE